MTETIKKRPSLAFDAWVMDGFVEMWENQEEDIDPTKEDEC